MRDSKVSAETIAEYQRAHFCKRVHERIGRDVDAARLYREIIKAVESGSDFVRYRCKARQKGRRIYRIAVKGVEWFIVYDKGEKRPITVLPQDWIGHKSTFDPRRLRGKSTRSRFKPSGRREARRGKR